MATIVNDRDVLLATASQRRIAGEYATVLLRADTQAFYIDASNNHTPNSITLTATLVNLTGTVNFSASGATVTNVTPVAGTNNTTATVTFAGMVSPSATITASVVVGGKTYSADLILSKVTDGGGGTPGQNGADGLSYATAYLYKWSTVQPATPSANSTFTWASGANTSYAGTDGWAISPPANPGTPGVYLWVAAKPVSATVGTATSSVSYTGGTVSAYTLNGANGANGAPGIKNTGVKAYQWAIGAAPTITGTSTYTWATNSYTNVPSGWSATKPTAPAAGYTLYEATVFIVDASGASTSSVDWTTASVVGVGYIGTDGANGGVNGSSATVAYTLVDGTTLNSTPSSVSVSGQALPTTGTWGETRAWTSQPSVPSAGQSVFQSNGIYNPTTNSTTWGLPYLSSLRVGQLSAISANLGTITAGSIDIGAGKAVIDVNGNASFKAITIKDASGNTILQSGGQLALSAVPNAALNSAISISSNGTLSGAGGGKVTIGGLGYYGDLGATYGATFGSNIFGQITSANASTYIASAAIGDAQIGNLSASKITTGSLSASRISGGTITGVDISIGGVLVVTTSGTPYVNLAYPRIVRGTASNSDAPGVAALSHTSYGSGPAISAQGSTGGNAIDITGGANGIVQTGGGASWLSGLNPSISNAYSLGESFSVWTNVYASSGAVTTSDARTKTDITDSNLGLNFINSLRPVSYKQIVAENIVEDNWVITQPEVTTVDDFGDLVVVTAEVKENQRIVTPRAGVRNHYGLIAQEVRATLIAHGEDNGAMWSLADKNDPDSQQALRYEEFVAPLIKAVQELSAQVQALQAQLNAQST